MKNVMTNKEKKKSITDEKSSKKALWMSTGLAAICVLLAHKKSKEKE